jgi:hypothetical protein
MNRVVAYTCGFYRHRQSTDDTVIRKTLVALDRLDLGFFPARLEVGRKKTVILERAEDYGRQLIPKQFFITSTSATIPLDGKNGIAFTFTESDDPSVMPASLVLEMSSRTLEANDLFLDRLVSLILAVVSPFSPDFAGIWDNAQRARAEYGSVMFRIDRRRVPLGVFWVNYYSTSWVENIGRSRIERLKEEVPLLRWLGDGAALFATQSDAYDEGNIENREKRARVEGILELGKVHREFPNPGA